MSGHTGNILGPGGVEALVADARLEAARQRRATKPGVRRSPTMNRHRRALLEESRPAQPPKRDLAAETSTGVPLEYRIDDHPSIDKLAKLFARAFGREQTDMEGWQQKQNTAVKTVSVFAGDALIGYVRANADPYDPELAIAEDAMVLPRYQDRGIFSKMVQIGLEQLAQDGYSEVRFAADPGTEEMYAHMGFVAGADGLAKELANRGNNPQS